MKNTSGAVLTSQAIKHYYKRSSALIGKIATLSIPQPVNQQPRNQHILTSEGNRLSTGFPTVNRVNFETGITRSIIFSVWKNFA